VVLLIFRCIAGEGYAFKISKSAFIDQLVSVDIKLEYKTIVVNLKSKPDLNSLYHAMIENLQAVL
jgi:hypothetical protein